MADETVERLQNMLREKWGSRSGVKVERYVGKFWGRERREGKITAVVEGNHGNYTVSIEAHEQGAVTSACSCYIGKHGYCHHCAALALTFLAEPDSFVAIKKVEKTAVSDLDTLRAYLDGITLDELIKQMRAKGITQKAFCEAVGMSTRHLTAVKSAESRNHRYHELGAIKLAVLWMLENFEKHAGKN